MPYKTIEATVEVDIDLSDFTDEEIIKEMKDRDITITETAIEVCTVHDEIVRDWIEQNWKRIRVDDLNKIEGFLDFIENKAA